MNRGSNTMQVFNISNPAAPTLIAIVVTGPTPQSVAIAGSHAYVVSSGSHNLHVFDISTPSAPALVATIAADRLRIRGRAGNHAYGTSNNMLLFDISNPEAPTLRATIATGTGPQFVAVEGGTAYVVNINSNNMTVYDLYCPNMITMDASTGTITSQTAPWVNYGEHIANTNGGNVGIGTTTPASRLMWKEGGGATYSGTNSRTGEWSHRSQCGIGTHHPSGQVAWLAQHYWPTVTGRQHPHQRCQRKCQLAEPERGEHFRERERARR
ncbi:MAG: hypothetical protein IPG74_16620 [Flavobacteriales bacterium]|nr:hypothetical protein [Flavobacteriales bacterium]